MTLSPTPLLLRSEWGEIIVSYFLRLRHAGWGLWGVALELLMIGFVVYVSLRFLQGTRGERLLKSFGIIIIASFLVVRLIADKLQLDRIIFLYPYFVAVVVLTTLIAFQPEVRRGLIRLGDARWFRSLSKQAERVIDPLVTAATHLSQKKIGALIAIERDVGVEAVIETGVRLDAELSCELLETIFWPGSVLHDMGVIVRHGRIAAAACQFPIAESGELMVELGSRHRAALGLSHECDAVIVVVSEETGTISIAYNDVLERHFTPAALRSRLLEILGTRGEPPATENDDAPVLTESLRQDRIIDVGRTASTG